MRNSFFIHFIIIPILLGFFKSFKDIFPDKFFFYCIDN